MTDWRPVATLPPIVTDSERSADVLIATSDGTRVGYCRVDDEGDVSWFLVGRDAYRAEPTHWATLPNTPQQEAEGMRAYAAEHRAFDPAEAHDAIAQAKHLLGPQRDTTPIENCLPAEDAARWVEEYATFSRLLGWPRDLVRMHRARLGKQQRTVVHEHRMWVWQCDRWTVFVSNIRGVCFEVPRDTSVEGAWAAWRDYVKTITRPEGP